MQRLVRVHRAVGALQRGLERIARVAGRQPDRQAQCMAALAGMELVVELQQREDALAHRLGAALVGLRHQHRELVAADAADDVAWAIPERLAAATAATIGEDVMPPEPDGEGWNPAALAGVDCSAMMLSVMLMMMLSGAVSRNASIAVPVIVFAVVVVAQRA